MDKPVTLEAAVVVDKKAEKERKKAEREAKKKAKDAAKGGPADDGKLDVDKVLAAGVDASLSLTKEQQRVAANRAVTGVLASAPYARDVKFESFSVSLGGKCLVSDCYLELTQGCRYGLMGDNGSGKSSVLSAIAQREVPLPSFISAYHLHEEAPPSDMSGVQAVINHVVEETAKLEALAEQIMEESGPEDERLETINGRLEELDPVGAEPKARKILSGLGFAVRGVGLVASAGGSQMKDPICSQIPRRAPDGGGIQIRADPTFAGSLGPDGSRDQAHVRRLEDASGASPGAPA